MATGSNYSSSHPSPGRYLGAKAVDVSTTDYTGEPSTGLWVGTGGDVKVDMIGKGATLTGVGVVFTVADKTLLPVSVSKIYHSGTTASGIIVLY